MSQTLSQRNRDRILTTKANYDAIVGQMSAPPATGFYRGVQNGRHVIQSLSGDRYYCDSISNGATAIGDKVGLNLTIGGTPQMDAMPR